MLSSISDDFVFFNVFTVKACENQIPPTNFQQAFLRGTPHSALLLPFSRVHWPIFICRQFTLGPDEVAMDIRVCSFQPDILHAKDHASQSTPNPQAGP